MAAIEKRLEKHATASSFVSAKLMSMYTVASLFSWQNVVRMAALNTLCQPLEEVPCVYELGLITSADLYRLLHFRFDCTYAACIALVNSAESVRRDPMALLASCSVYYNNLTGVVQAASDKTWSRTLFERLRSCPRGSTITNLYSQELPKLLADKQEGKLERILHPFSTLFYVGKRHLE